MNRIKNSWLAGMRRRTGMSSLVAATVLLSAAAAHAAPGTAWSYSENGGGYIEHTGGDCWQEVVGNGGVVFNFREVNGNSSYVELYDHSRNIWVKIHDRISFIRYPGSNGYQRLYYGRWVR